MADIPIMRLFRDILATRAATGTSYGKVKYSAKVEDVVGLMEATEQVNHGMTRPTLLVNVPLTSTVHEPDIGVDGVVKVITVNITEGEEFFNGTGGYADGAFGEQVTTTVWIAPTDGA